MKNIYVCGPTVYDSPHIGNLRPILVFDIYVRSLKALGEQVRMIHNITDIDDQIIQKAIKENVAEKVISARYIKIYNELLKTLKINSIDEQPLVTTNINGIIKFIILLIRKGFAYKKNGDVYFEISKLYSYGKTSNRKIKDMKFNKSKNKKNPGDFALWKKTKVGIAYNSPWGQGRPGWHTECAYLVSKFAPEGLYVHGGGTDLIFPHHENEEAQFKSTTGNSITKNWKRIGNINIDGIKMSKSLGNIIDAQEFININNNNTLRMIFLMTSPTSPINITKQIIDDANKKIIKIKKVFIKSSLTEKISLDKNTISKEISNWNFSKAMFILNKNIKDYNSGNTHIAGEMLANISILGIFDEKDALTGKWKGIFNEWEKLKLDKNFKKADQIRKKLLIQKIL